MEVPEAGDPETQGAGTQLGVEQLALGPGQRTHGLVGRKHGFGALGIMGTCCVIDTPIVEADRKIEEPGVHAREIEVEKAGQPLAVEHHVVAEQVGMDGAARQGRIAGRGGDMVLIGQLGAQHGGGFLAQMGQDHGHGFIPPGQAAQIGLLAVVVLSGQMHARQHLAHGSAVHGSRGQLAFAGQAVDDGCGLAADLEQNVTAACLALRVRHGNPGLCQMLHQVEVKRQLLGTQALEQCQHPLSLVGRQKIVGVFNAALNAAQFLERA